jgi:tight adherence protein B
MGGFSSTNLLLLLGVIAAMFVVTFFFFVRSLIESRERRLAKRLSETGDAVPDRLELKPDPSMKGFNDFLTRSGIGISPEQAVGWMLFVGTIIACGLFLIRQELWLGLIGVIAGMAIVWIVLMIMRYQHRLKLQDQMPDTIFLIARSLRAGLSLEQSIALVGNQGIEPLATEFRRANNQIQLGLTIPMALSLTAKRLRLIDFDSFVSTISLYTHTGGNLPLLLDRLAASIREQNQFRAFFRSATALGRLSAIFIAAAGPLFFIAYALMEPEYARFFFTSQVGILTMIMVVAVEAIGLVWMWNIIRLEY